MKTKNCAGETNRILNQYLKEIRRHPLLSKSDELRLALRVADHGDAAAAQQLVNSNLRLVVKTAHRFMGYGNNLLELIQEGNIGLMVAVRKFDPRKGWRLISYAVWWIRAYIQSFALKSWSLVKLGTTQAQRKLFFGLRTARGRADREAGPGACATSEKIAAMMQTNKVEVENMTTRLGTRDVSLSTARSDGTQTWGLDRLYREQMSPSSICERKEMLSRLHTHVDTLRRELNSKEQYVLQFRILGEVPQTLREAGEKLKISRERVRQIEVAIIQKLRCVFLAAESAASARYAIAV